ncbi:MAG: gamma-glutamyltransferase, partial [Paracoccaceae bacterium]
MRIENYPNYPSRRSPVIAQNMVAASQPLAAQAGLQMLKRGGNAVDAALATAITLTLVEPTGCGLGSDAFAIIWDGNCLHGLNSSGRSPASWTKDRFSNFEEMPYRGWESVTVPGMVAGWVSLSEKFGKLPFQELFEPAVRYAESGFAVSPIIAQQWSLGAGELTDQPGFSENFLKNGNPPAAGEIYTNIGFSQSLRLIAETKGEAFYSGVLAEKIDAYAKEHDAALRLSDLAEHKPDWSGTISKDFHGVSLHEIPPNGQ